MPHRRTQPPHGRGIFPDAPLVRVVGQVHHFEIERAGNEAKIDHVWLTLDAGLPTPILVSLNTLSWRNRLAGFDPRIRLALLAGQWTQLPPRGLSPVGFFDYETVEVLHPLVFEPLERRGMEEYFGSRCAECLLVEAWGAPYHRHRPGIHQVHSRRASSAVPVDRHGMDGAIRFYFDRDRRTELALLKFTGQ